MSRMEASKSRKIEFGDFFVLAYLIFYFLEPLARHSGRYWLESLGILCVFLALYFAFLRSRSATQQHCIVAECFCWASPPCL